MTTWLPYPVPLTAEQTREGRMLLVLLTSTDPLGLIEAGYTPDVYSSTASAALYELEQGGGVDELLKLFLTARGDQIAHVHAFTCAAVAWWVSDAFLSGRGEVSAAYQRRR
jgi:hypothetical protein